VHSVLTVDTFTLAAPSCKMNCHRRCSIQVGNLCGLNQKDMASELGKLGLTPEVLQGNAKPTKYGMTLSLSSTCVSSSCSQLTLLLPRVDARTHFATDIKEKKRQAKRDGKASSGAE
jgi:hypothetical protein